MQKTNLINLLHNPQHPGVFLAEICVCFRVFDFVSVCVCIPERKHACLYWIALLGGLW